MALVISRKIGETIIIDGEIEVTVLPPKFGETRLAITAPRSVTINREEIQNRIDAGLQSPINHGVQS